MNRVINRPTNRLFNKALIELKKGNCVFEYRLKAGNSTANITSLQGMYAPEFSIYSDCE